MIKTINMSSATSLSSSPSLREIAWENANTGMETSFYGSQTRVYTRTYAIKEACCGYIRQLVAKPKNLQNQKYDAYKEYSFAPLPSARPRFTSKDMLEIRCIMDKHVPRLLVQHGKSQLSNDLDNFTFLLTLGLKRNWKSECVICLSEDMMGTTCGCGHTEIVVFRPCGHSICVSPCFNEYIKNKGVQLKEEEMQIGGQTFIVGQKLGINDCKNFKCPTCNVNVEKCFRAEDVYTSDEIGESISKSIVELVGKMV